MRPSSCGDSSCPAADRLCARRLRRASVQRQFDAKIGLQPEPLSLLCPSCSSLASKRCAVTNVERGLYCCSLKKCLTFQTNGAGRNLATYNRTSQRMLERKL